MIRREGPSSYPYAECPLYQRNDTDCCGRRHEAARDEDDEGMIKKVLLQFLSGTEEIKPLVMEPPKLELDNWCSRVSHTRALRQALKNDAEPTLLNRQGVLDQTKPHQVITPLSRECPLASKYFIGSDSNPTPPQNTDLSNPNSP